MKCQKCGSDFEEKDIQLSHDVPKYIGGTDADGRHYMCKKCHDIYKKSCFYFMIKYLSEEIKKHMRNRAREFALRWFNGTGI